MTLHQIMSYLLFALACTMFYFIVREKGKDIWEGIVGENKKLDIPELIAFCAIILFIIGFLANLFLDYEVMLHIWASVDFIIASSIGGRMYLEKIKSSREKEKK